MADDLFGVSVGAMTMDQCKARFSGIRLVSGVASLSTEAAGAFATDAEGRPPGCRARRAAYYRKGQVVVICYRCG